MRLLTAEELAPPGSRSDRPAHDNLQAYDQPVCVLRTRAGEEGTAEAIALLGGERAELARDLSYRLFTICERHKWAREALAYTWSGVERSEPVGHQQTSRRKLNRARNALIFP